MIEAGTMCHVGVMVGPDGQKYINAADLVRALRVVANESREMTGDRAVHALAEVVDAVHQMQHPEDPHTEGSKADLSENVPPSTLLH